MAGCGVVLAPEPERGFTITVPAFPEYAGYAVTETEARDLAQEGTQFELDRLRGAGQPAPIEAGPPLVMHVAA